MARRRSKGRKRSAMTIPIATVLGATAGMIQPIQRGLQGDTNGALNDLVENYTGYNMTFGSFNFQGLMRGFAPLIAGVAVSSFASLFGVNRRLGRAKIPLIRI